MGTGLPCTVSLTTSLSWQWDTFGHLMEPLTSVVPTMYSIGNHEYDYPKAYGTIYPTAMDSGGECGVPYKERHPMPIADEDGLYYSINHGPIHFLQLNTELEFSAGSPQWNFALTDLENVNRSITPWLVVGFHRMMYTGSYSILIDVRTLMMRA